MKSHSAADARQNQLQKRVLQALFHLRCRPTFRPWTHTSDDSYIYQLSLVLATATVSFYFSFSSFPFFGFDLDIVCFIRSFIMWVLRMLSPWFLFLLGLVYNVIRTNVELIFFVVLGSYTICFGAGLSGRLHLPTQLC